MVRGISDSIVCMYAQRVVVVCSRVRSTNASYAVVRRAEKKGMQARVRAIGNLLEISALQSRNFFACGAIFPHRLPFSPGNFRNRKTTQLPNFRKKIWNFQARVKLTTRCLQSVSIALRSVTSIDSTITVPKLAC